MNKIKILKENIDICDVIDMLNDFEDGYLFYERDMYQSGEWLYADVDIKDTRVKKQMNTILLNIEEYIIENNKWFTHSEDRNIVGLSYLVQYCEETFKSSIKYSRDDETDETYFYIE